MTEKQFFQSVTNGSADIVGELLELLDGTKTRYCLIGGLAVNAYCDPVVSLDLDLIIAVDDIQRFISSCEAFKQTEFEHSLNLSTERSDLRIQVQKDGRYQSFLERAVDKAVLGYQMKVAHVEDVLRGKIWAFTDKERRASKRQKDLADIARLVETYPELTKQLPVDIQHRLKE